MILFRSLLYFLALVFSTLFFATLLLLVGWVLPFHRRSQIANKWGSTNLTLQQWLCGLDYRVTGQENIPASNCVILSKHQSAWETIALRHIMPAQQVWVLKRELMWIPFFGWALALFHPIAIDRKSGRKAVSQIIRQGTEQLKKGRWVVIFPEGTRVAPGERKRYGIGGALLAEHSGYPVLPVAHNAGVYWRRRGILKYPGTIQVVIGPVIETDGLRATEINARVEEWIESTMAALPQTRDEVNTQLNRGSNRE
ncbi:MAG TPA: 1-acyl-sn-glycerol-3-phosphate acyltransferase [Chromatiales bacterium]|nr:1-acyl-sn-glycerol-3-phosphate acyltransferase [Chromatiales bacterium]